VYGRVERGKYEKSKETREKRSSIRKGIRIGWREKKKI
jgi:hypothetical protein